MPTNYDVNEVIRQFINLHFPERADLIREITAELKTSRAAMHLLSEIGKSCVRKNLGPIEGLSLGMMYGMVIGILLEQERLNRSRSLVS